jgi:hypothetical protein
MNDIASYYDSHIEARVNYAHKRLLEVVGVGQHTMPAFKGVLPELYLCLDNKRVHINSPGNQGMPRILVCY